MAKVLTLYKKGNDTAIASGNETKATITGLKPNTKVAAGDYLAAYVDGDQTSDKVDVPAFTTLDIVLAAPSLEATPHDAAIDYAITAGTDNGGSAVTAYKVSYSIDGSSWTDVDISDPTQLAGTIDGLTNGTEYQIKVIATNGAGDSPESTVVKATPVAPEPDEPKDVEADPGTDSADVSAK